MTTPAAEPTSLELSYYLAVLRRQAWIVVLCVLIGLGLGVAYLSLASREVTATTVTNLNVISSDPFSQQRSPADMLDPDTELQLVQSSAVLQQAAAAMGVPSTTDVRHHTKSSLVGDTTVMRISYTANDAQTAEEGADAVADAYLQFRSDQAAARVDAIVKRLGERRQTLRDDLVRLNTIIKESPTGSGRQVQAQSDRDLTNIELNSLSSQVNTFEGLDTTGGTVLTTAAQSPTSVSPSRAAILGTGLALGLIIGVVLAFVANALDRRIRDAHDVRRAGGGTVLAELTDKQVTVPASGNDLDKIRSVRELLFATLPGDKPSLVVADLTPADASDVAVTLAHTVAETGRSVELIMPAARAQTVEEVADALELKPIRSGADAQRFAGTHPLTLVAPTNDTSAVHGDRGDDAHPAMTVLAIPPGAAHSSLLAAGRLDRQVMLVVSKKGTTRKGVAEATRELPALGTRVHGTILVPKKRRPRRPGRGRGRTAAEAQ